MPRFKLTIEYDGTPFAGWQWQDDAPTVQRALTDAIAAFCGHAVKVAGAGRTDAGVHALGQVAHVDLAKDWRVDKVRDAVNAHLRPHPIAVLSAEKVPDDFDARFSAPVLLGETFFTRVEIGRVRRIGQSIHVQFRFRMWKPDGKGGEIETYRSEQHAILFPPE